MRCTGCASGIQDLMNEINVRRYALDLLCDIEREGKYTNIALDFELNRRGVQGSDRALLTALVYGVVERKITLDYIIGMLSKRPLETVDRRVINLLRLGLYQIRYMDKIPPHAAVNESVALGKNRGEAAFVNAILRAYLRCGEEIKFPDPSEDPVYAMSVEYSVSEWICRLFIESYGIQTAKEILESMSEVPDVTLRANTQKVSRDRLLDILRKSGVAAALTELSKHGIRLLERTPVTALPGFSEGLYFVQDEASQFCVDVLDPLPEQVVIDTCAAPGSKSFSAALLMENKGKVLSFDIHKKRIDMIRQGADKLGITIIHPEYCDAKKPQASLFGKADAVLCDVPCSGLGILAKKPDIRYKEEESIQRLPEIQLEILRASASYVKAGGVLVYSTCTINPAENEEVVGRFLEEMPGYSLCDFPLSAGGMLTLLPHLHNTDGFFIAKMKKHIE